MKLRVMVDDIGILQSPDPLHKLTSISITTSLQIYTKEWSNVMKLGATVRLKPGLKQRTSLYRNSLPQRATLVPHNWSGNPEPIYETYKIFLIQQFSIVRID